MRAETILPHEKHGEYRNEAPENPPAWSILESDSGVRDRTIYLGRWIEGVFHTAAVFPAGVPRHFAEWVARHLNAASRREIMPWPRS